MSFLPPIGPNPREGDFARERQREVEAEAARYADRHPDLDDRDATGGVRRLVARMRKLIRHRD